MTERERNGIAAYGLLHSICTGEMAPRPADVESLGYDKPKPHPAPDEPRAMSHRVSVTVPATGEHIALVTRVRSDGIPYPVTAVICNRELMATTPDEREAEQIAVHDGSSFILAPDGNFEDVFAHMPGAEAWLDHADETRDRIVLALSTCGFGF